MAKWKNRTGDTNFLREKIPSDAERAISCYQQIQVLEIDALSCQDAFLPAAIVRRFWSSHGPSARLSGLPWLHSRSRKICEKALCLSANRNARRNPVTSVRPSLTPRAFAADKPALMFAGLNAATHSSTSLVRTQERAAFLHAFLHAWLEGSKGIFAPCGFRTTLRALAS